jgi:cation:H+ antiporter
VAQTGQIPTLWLFCGMGVASALVVWSGVKLVHCGDALGQRYKLSRTWIGVIVLAMITSLPELVVTLSAQLAVARPRLAMSNVCGSNLINLCIFAVIDFCEGPQAISGRVSRRLLKPAMMGLLCMGIAVVGFLLPVVGRGQWVALLGWPVSVAILLVCIYTMVRTQRGEEIPQEPAKVIGAADTVTGPGLGLRFAVNIGALVGGGIVLIVLADSLVERRLHLWGASFVLGETVVGTIGLALVTSLPELVVGLAAVRIGALDMAVGNLLGSNIFNVMLLPLAHFVRPMQSFWSSGMRVHGMSLVTAMVLTCIVAAGIRRGSRTGIVRMGWDAILVAIIGGSALAAVVALGIEL